MRNFNIERLNLKKLELGEKEIVLKSISYKEPIIVNNRLLDENGDYIGTKGDMYTKLLFDDILQRGCLDYDPRPKYEDGEPAHTLSLNHGLTTCGITTYDLTKGESPLITLRPIATKSSIGELLWIYQDESNNLDLLKEKYGITWWDQWEVENTRTIGSVYGETVRVYNSMRRLLDGLEKDKYGRRHIICLWQENQFEKPHGLKPCAYLTTFNVRKEWDSKEYLDMSLKQRSSDFATAGCINQVQYLVFQHLIARHLDLIPGQFTWQYDNIQIYDRHIEQVIEMMNRTPINCNPKIEINPNKTNFYDMEVDDIKIVDYPKQLIKEKNPQLRFPIGV